MGSQLRKANQLVEKKTEHSIKKTKELTKVRNLLEVAKRDRIQALKRATAAEGVKSEIYNDR